MVFVLYFKLEQSLNNWKMVVHDWCQPMSTVPAHPEKMAQAHRPDGCHPHAQTTCSLSEPWHHRRRCFPTGAHRVPPPAASRCPRAPPSRSPITAVSSTLKVSPSRSPLFMPASFLCSPRMRGQPPSTGPCCCALRARAAAPRAPPQASSPRPAPLSSK
jgi:hypothetical protein